MQLHGQGSTSVSSPASAAHIGKGWRPSFCKLTVITILEVSKSAGGSTSSAQQHGIFALAGCIHKQDKDEVMSASFSLTLHSNIVQRVEPGCTRAGYDRSQIAFFQKFITYMAMRSLFWNLIARSKCPLHSQNGAHSHLDVPHVTQTRCFQTRFSGLFHFW